MSGVPSPSRSPIPATEWPNSSPASSVGPSTVEEFISTVSFIVPSAFISITWIAPLSVLPSSSLGAPAAMSGVPSEFMSPIWATERPKLSPFASDGPFAVKEFISIVPCTLPLATAGTGPASDIRCSMPLPNDGWAFTPTAISGVPSPSRSPTGATE